MTSVLEPAEFQESRVRVERFVARFGNPDYRLLAYHAALPLVLTPELVHYFRTGFLRAENVPWEAEVDLLLSDLCRQVGYELYVMDTPVRAYLLEEIQDVPFWQQRMREVAQVLIGYVNFLSRMHPGQRQKELEAQRLAAMVYLGDEACQQAAEAIAAQFKQITDLAAERTGSERGIRSELARLARLTQELAPKLQEVPALMDYARLVQRLLTNPEAVSATELQQTRQVGDIVLTLSPHLFSRSQTEVPGAFAGFPPLQSLEFETGQLVEQDVNFPSLQTQQVESVTLFFEVAAPQTSQAEPVPEKVVIISSPSWYDITVPEIEQVVASATDFVLKPFSFEIGKVKLNSSNTMRWVVIRSLAEAQLYEERLSATLSIDMVAVSGGRFIMGSPTAEGLSRERPQHEVTVNAFYMGRYPVTQAQWQFVAGLSAINRKLDSDPSEFKGEKRPVEQVSWYDAVEFCDRLSTHTGRTYRLPTEAEWEYACRAGTQTSFSFGETLTTEIANYQGNSYNSGLKGRYRGETTPVDYFAIANAFGLCDMHGNIWEWCLDHWHSNYEGAPTDGSAWLSENENADRVNRGGSWIYLPGGCRSACRNNYPPDYRDLDGGFRVVCSVLRTL